MRLALSIPIKPKVLGEEIQLLSGLLGMEGGVEPMVAFHVRISDLTSAD